MHTAIVLSIFVIGYFLIAFEFRTQINRATVALLMAVFCWVMQFMDPVYPLDLNQKFLAEKVYAICQVFFFLLGAFTIVELISVHRGFSILTYYVQVRSKRKFLVLISLTTFFLSSVLDNLSTAVIMLAILRHLIHEDHERCIYGGMIVIAANAGGAWTPIGDVTTTMLWLGGQVDSLPLMGTLFLPSLTCVLVAMTPYLFLLSGDLQDKELQEHERVAPVGRLVFYLGVGSLMFVPIFAEITGLPPFMGVLLGLGLLWLVTDIAHREKDGRDHLRVTHVLSRVDLSGVLFFLGILLAINAMEVSGILAGLEQGLERTFGHVHVTMVAMGIFSAVMDNIPLVAIAMGMYSLSEYPVNSELWQLAAYCINAGGSLFVIGSAAGLAYMGIEKITFRWFLKYISGPAFLGYLSGVMVFFLQSFF